MEVKDIEFKSADHVIEEIRNMNVKGGSPFGRAAAWAFKLVSEQETFSSKDSLINRYEDVAKQMIDLKPTMATIYNTWHIVKNTLRKIENVKDVEKVKKEVSHVCSNIIDYSFEAVSQVGEYGSNLVQENDIIMMHSYSSTLMEIFIKAAEKGKNFTVICTESRPLRESRVAIKILQKLNIKVIYITDASIYEFLPKADYVIMGADSICYDGSVANKMGTAMISKLACLCKKPVYIASELYKLDLRTLYGYKIKLERRSETEIVSKGDFDSLDGIEVINQFFDLTPATDINSIICEYGIVSPAQIAGFWSKLEGKVME